MTRDQFIMLITQGFFSLIFDDMNIALSSVMANDKATMNTYLTNYLRANLQIAANLATWDGLPTQAAKDAFAVSVVYVLGSATVDPETALNWPDSNGRFGNIKGPATSVIGHLLGFNSTVGDVAQDNGAAIAQVNCDWNASSGLAQILNKPTIPSTPSQSSATRALNTAFQVSTTRNSNVGYCIDISTTVSLSGSQTGTVVLEMATNSAFTTGVQTLQQFSNGNSGTLVIGLVLTQLATATLNAFVPAGNWVRLRTVNVTGTPTFTYQCGQEILV